MLRVLVWVFKPILHGQPLASQHVFMLLFLAAVSAHVLPDVLVKPRKFFLNFSFGFVSVFNGD